MIKNVFLFVLLSVLAVIHSGSSEYQILIKQFVELRLKTGLKQEDLGILSAELKHNFDLSLKSLKGEYRILRKQCLSSYHHIDKEIKHIESVFVESNIALRNWKITINQSQEEKQNSLVSIKSLKDEYFRIGKSHGIQLLDYKNSINEINSQLKNLDEIRRLIIEELLNQSDNENIIKNKVERLKSVLTEIRKGMENLLSSQVSLVDMALFLGTEQNFSDKNTLNQINLNLTQLRRNIMKSKNEIQSNFVTEHNRIKKQLANILKNLENYSKLKAQSTRKLIDAKNYILYYNSELSHLNAEKLRKTKEKNILVNLCKFQKAFFKEEKIMIKKFSTLMSKLLTKVQVDLDKSN